MDDWNKKGGILLNPSFLPLQIKLSQPKLEQVFVWKLPDESLLVEGVAREFLFDLRSVLIHNLLRILIVQSNRFYHGGPDVAGGS